MVVHRPARLSQRSAPPIQQGSAPPIRRTPMAPRDWLAGTAPAPLERQHRGLNASAALRRAILLTLVIIQSAAAACAMAGVLPYGGRQPLEVAIIALFIILFAWISAGFWTAIMGFLVQFFGGDRHAISRTISGSELIDPAARTALIMPVYNEDVRRVFAGLRAVYESLARSGELAHFDFYVLSDSTDPQTRTAEIAAWDRMRSELGGAERVFYRWRRHRIKKKSGNVADFCRRWGVNYRYMVVLDADSVMSGQCLASLVRMMEANPYAGIIQSAPLAAGRDTLYARIQQFANRVYGPLFTAGLHFWQLSESHYWGHNAIIRVQPFMRHCALARLPGRGVFSGEILSHDFVEAALMRRAGWGVWIAYDLPGSFEEMPPNLIDELKRDQRWCQGNLINARLLLARGMRPAHRAIFATGVMAYASAPLWFLSLLLSTALLAVHTLVPPAYFVMPYQLFPVWPQWDLEWALTLFGATFALLILPKVLGTLLAMVKERRGYGGCAALLGSLLLEILFSAALAPIRMLFHTQYVLGALVPGLRHWKSPPREDAQTSWREAFVRHGWQSVLGLAWAGLAYWLNPSFLWWLLPVVGALALSIPLSVYSSRVSLGRRMRSWNLFLIPEERHPPLELRRTAELSQENSRRTQAERIAPRIGGLRAAG